MDWMKDIFKDATEEQMSAFKSELGKHFVPNDQYKTKVNTLTSELEATTTKLTESQNTITELNGKLNDFKPEEIEQYKETINKLNTDLETFKTEGVQRETRLKKRYALKDQFTAAKMNPDALDLVVGQYKDNDLDKFTLGEDGKIADFETNILNPTKESKPSLFATTQTKTKPPEEDKGGEDDNLDAIKKAMGL